MVLVMMASAVALQPAFVSSSVLALGVCSAVFSALALVLLERSLVELSDVSGVPNSNSTGSFGPWRNCALIGKDLGMYLSLGFLGASLTLERFPLRILGHMGVYFEEGVILLALKLVVISALGAAQWALTLFVVSTAILHLIWDEITNLSGDEILRCQCRVSRINYDAPDGNIFGILGDKASRHGWCFRRDVWLLHCKTWHRACSYPLAAIPHTFSATCDDPCICSHCSGDVGVCVL